MPIRAVVFDFGSVLCPMPQAADFEPLCRLTGLSTEVFLHYFWRDRLDYDRGTLDGPTYWRAFAQMAQVTLSNGQIEKLIAEDVAMWQKLDPVLMEWAHKLRQSGFKTAVLSNMPRDLAGYLRSHADWLKQFDHAVFSGELGVVKPNVAIYRASLAGLGVKPGEALFIDDNPANVEGAQAVGMQALHFASTAQLAKDIQPFGLPLLGATRR